MTHEELLNRISELTKDLSNTVDEKEKNKIKKEILRLKNTEKHALTYSDDVNDPDTAISLYTTKQFPLFLGLSEGVCRRIRKGFYATKQKYLIEDLNSSDINRRMEALKILRFDISKFKDIDWNTIKFEVIEKELDKRFWSF